MRDTNRHMMMAAIVAAGLAWSLPAAAADNAMQVCGARYQAAKTAKTLPAGQTWNQYLAACRATLPKTTATATSPKPAAIAVPAKPAVAARPAAAPRVAGQLSPAQVAERGRIKQCAAQWQSDKAANRIPAGQKWPQYWSACSKRLKG